MQEEAILNLKWDSFSSQLRNSLDSCYEKQYFVDLSLVCKNGTILKCHKMVLSNASAFFRRLLVNNEHPHPMIILHDIDADDLKTIVNFMYCGEIQVVKSEVTRILKIAEILEVSGLKDIRSTVSIPEIGDSSQRDDTITSGEPEFSLKSENTRCLMRTNMAAEASNPIGPSVRKRARIGAKSISGFEERDQRKDESAKRSEIRVRSNYDSTRKTDNFCYENNLGNQASASTSGAEKFNELHGDGKSSKRPNDNDRRISWNKVLSEISKEDRMTRKKLCLINEIEITASKLINAADSKAERTIDNAAGRSAILVPNADCEIFIKDEIHVTSDADGELRSPTMEEYCAENDPSIVDSPVEIFERVRCMGGAISVSPKHIDLFQLLKRKGSSG